MVDDDRSLRAARGGRRTSEDPVDASRPSCRGAVAAVGQPPQTLGQAPPWSGQLDGAARIKAHARRRAIRPRRCGCWMALHLSPLRLGGTLDLLREDEGERLEQDGVAEERMAGAWGGAGDGGRTCR